MKKESLFAAIDQRQAEILSWGDTFFDCAELGFQEVKTAAAITSLLDQWNIPYESGIAMTGIRVTLGSGSPHIAFVSDMDAWLKCHIALILPACYLCYACSGDLSKATKEQRDLVLDAAWEACEMMKAAHIPVDDKENTDCYRAGTPGRRKMDAMLLAICKTPLGRLCVSDHAMHAVAEMQYLDEAFEGLRAQTQTQMTAWDTLRGQMPSWDIIRKKTAKTRR